MNPRRESGYDPIGDPRTGRPPLPEERERMRRREPEEMDPSEISSARATSLTDEQSNEEDSMSQSLREAGEAVSVRVTEAASSAMEQGSALASAASGQLQTYTGDLLAFARRRPFAALLGAAVIGLLIGMLSRSRS
jgi:ElaB/YqjD/DUF883 family membrane-anchored ribosome-binding protein